MCDGVKNSMRCNKRIFVIYLLVIGCHLSDSYSILQRKVATGYSSYVLDTENWL